MPHLLAFYIVQTIGQIDGVIEKSGLCRSRGDNGYLTQSVKVVSVNCELAYSVPVEKQYLHLWVAAVPTTISTRYHLGDVVRDCGAYVLVCVLIVVMRRMRLMLMVSSQTMLAGLKGYACSPAYCDLYDETGLWM